MTYKDDLKKGKIHRGNFEANKNYVSKKPFIQKLNIKFFSDAEELLKAFNTKRIDGFGDLSPKNIEDIKLNHQIIEINIPRYYAVFFNPNSDIAYTIRRCTGFKPSAICGNARSKITYIA